MNQWRIFTQPSKTLNTRNDWVGGCISLQRAQTTSNIKILEPHEKFSFFSFYMNTLNGNSSGSFNFHINIFASFPCVLKGGLMRWVPLSMQRSATGHNVICHHFIKNNSNKNFQSWTIIFWIHFPSLENDWGVYSTIVWVPFIDGG